MLVLNSGEWSRAGSNLFGGAVATHGETWGQLKARYRDPVPASNR